MSIKDVRNQGRGVSSANVFRTAGVLQMRTNALFGAKNFGFSKVMVCPHGQGWFSHCGHFSDKEGVFFRNFVRTSFMEGPYVVLCLSFKSNLIEFQY